jgi:hypothetical protein
VHAFLRSECDEADVRTALGDAAPLYRDAPEAHEVRAAGSQVICAFIGEMVPRVDVDQVRFIADLIETTLTQVGSRFSETKRSVEEVANFADAMANMFCAHLERVG